MPSLYNYSGVSEYTGETYHITIDRDRDEWLGEASLILLKEGRYMLDSEECGQEALARAACAYASDQEHAQRIYEYASRLWFMFASPVLSNAANAKGLPISCYLSQVDDSREGLSENWKESLFLSTSGGGIGTDMSLIRSVGTKNSRGTSTPGLIPFIKVLDSITAASRQGEVRRGATAVYLDVGHPEIEEFIAMRDESDGGDMNRKCMTLHHAVNIPDDFMKAVVNGSLWVLYDPHTKEAVKSIPARDLWQKILHSRMKNGEPYIHFVDASNRAMPEELKKKGLRINQSNLCVAPETLILTKELGEVPIDSVSGSLVSVWNGEEWSEVTPTKTSDYSRLMYVELGRYGGLWCTPEHKFYLSNLKGPIPAHSLGVGDILEPFFLPDDSEVPVEPVITGIRMETEEYPEGRYSPTYCFTEKKRGKGVFNGILTGNCSEITLPTTPDRTAVCCLSSVNLEYFNEWSSHPSFVQDVVEMLDNVLDVFIRKAPPELWRAINSARNERSIGLGAMGFHSYLQRNAIPFESAVASAANRKIFKHVKDLADKKSRELAVARGEAPDMEGSGKRFSFMIAVAPNASSSVICGFVSPSIEPYNANCYGQKTRRGVFFLKNKHLDILLRMKYSLSEERLLNVWDSIRDNEGSVQHLDFMEDYDKEIFKTAFEIDQAWVVDHASSRQPFICQGQSVNLFFPFGTTFNVLHQIHKAAWEKGLKTLYYVRSKAAGRITNTNKSTCVSCEG